MLRRWRQDELKLLTETYGKMLVERLSDQLGRTPKSVMWKARQIGLKSDRNRLRSTGWTKHQDEKLKELYNTMSASRVAKALNRKSLNGVYIRAMTLGLTAKNGDDRYFTSKPSIAKETIERYSQGEFLHALQEESGHSPHVFRKAMIRHGVRLRTHKEVPEHHMAKLQAGMRKGLADGSLRIKLSAARQGIPLENWKGFTSDWGKKIGKTPEWKQWRISVFRRDKFICVLCNKKGCKLLDPHHILRKKEHPNLIYDIDNGVTLCRPCHLAVTRKEDQFVHKFQSYVTALYDLQGV